MSLAKVKAGFLNHGTIEVRGQIILYCGGCSVHCRPFSSIPNLHPLDVSSTPSLAVKTKNAFNVAKRPQGANLSLVKNHQIREMV